MQYLLILISLLQLSAASFDEEIDFKFRTLPEADFIEYFNNLNLSWKITGNEDFIVPQQTENLFNFSKSIPNIAHDLDVDLPRNFDARRKWRHCPTIREIYDQGNCYSCWAFSAAMTASDRTCIHNHIVVRLSEQDLHCCEEAYLLRFCFIGFASKALDCWVRTGLVTRECKPYNITELSQQKCQQVCHNGKDYFSDKHYGQDIVHLNDDEKTIKKELFKNGSLLAGFKVYEDFTKYKHGIYEHKFGKFVNLGFVRVIGYGEQNGIKYWLAANSLGTKWGERGFFKIKMFQKSLFFEKIMTAVTPRER